MTGSTTKRLLSCVLLSLVILLTYAPVYHYTYDYHDAFYVSVLGEHAPCSNRPQFSSWLFDGRPLLAFLNCYTVTKWIHSIHDPEYVRLNGVLLLGICGWALASVLRRSGVRGFPAFLLAFLMLCLPGIQVFTSASHGTQILFAVLFTVFANFILQGSRVGSWRSWRAEWPRLVGSAICLLLAMLIYQQMTALFFALLAPTIIMADRESPTVRMTVWKAMGVYAITSLSYIVLHRAVLLPIYQWAGVKPEGVEDTARHVALSFDFGTKLTMLPSIAGNALGLWTIDYSRLEESVALGFLVIGILGCFASDVWLEARPRTISRLVRSLEPCGYLILLPALASIPNIVAPVAVSYYRVIFPLQAVILLVSVVGLMRFLLKVWGLRVHDVAAGVLLVFTLFVGWHVHENLRRNVAEINWKEFEFVRAELARMQCRLPGDVYVIQPGVANLGNYRRQIDLASDEFGRTTTMYSQDEPFIVFSALRDLGLPRSSAITVKAVRSPGPEVNNTAVLIDMRRFAALLGARPTTSLPGEQVPGLATDSVHCQEAGNPTLVEANYKYGSRYYNVVKYRGAFYAIAQGAGGFSDQRMKASLYTDYFVGVSADDVKKHIWNAPQ